MHSPSRRTYHPLTNIRRSYGLAIRESVSLCILLEIVTHGWRH